MIETLRNCSNPDQKVNFDQLLSSKDVTGNVKLKYLKIITLPAYNTAMGITNAKYYS